jgi:hypothetical protein
MLGRQTSGAKGWEDADSKRGKHQMGLARNVFRFQSEIKLHVCTFPTNAFLHMAPRFVSQPLSPYGKRLQFCGALNSEQKLAIEPDVLFCQANIPVDMTNRPIFRDIISQIKAIGDSHVTVDIGSIIGGYFSEILILTHLYLDITPISDQGFEKDPSAPMRSQILWKFP